jgi:hypothetical protein
MICRWQEPSEEKGPNMTAQRHRIHYLTLVLLVVLPVVSAAGDDLWLLANKNKDNLRISTLITSQQVRDYLGNEKGTQDAIDWCKKTGVTHVFIESFRDGYTAERATLERARDKFKAEGFDVSGCITTTGLGKTSTGYKAVSCYTYTGSQEQLQKTFEYAASMFDEIMIDDFLFTDCTCEDCQKARGEQSWADYRCDLMMKMSRERILGPAKKLNPNVKIIIKYPQWYDDFHNRGYDVIRQTADFDNIWVGTETRDFANPRWGGKVQYEAYYIMRWLGEIGGPKTGGGWFDPYGTTENTYVEQARQTVLADAHEMLLFCYGSLLRDTGPANVEKLRTEVQGLFELARIVRNKPIKGIIAPKPPNSDAGREQYVFDLVGVLGLPLVPTAKIDANAEAAFFAVHALKDPDFTAKLKKMLDAGKPVLMTDGLAGQLDQALVKNPNVTVLNVAGNPKNLLNLTREQLKPIRDKLLKPFGLKFDAPNKVALYLIGQDRMVIENFNDEPIAAALEFSRPVRLLNTHDILTLPGNANVEVYCTNRLFEFTKISPRTLIAFEY